MTHLLTAFVRCTRHRWVSHTQYIYNFEPKQLIFQRFSILTWVVNKCTVAFNKVSYESKKLSGIKFKAPWFSKFSRGAPIHLCRGCTSPAPYPTRLLLLRQDSVQVTLHFPPATFFLLSFNLKTLTLLGKQEPNNKNTRHISWKKMYILKFGHSILDILFSNTF